MGVRNSTDRDDEQTMAAVETGRAVRALHGDDADPLPDRYGPVTRPTRQDGARAHPSGAPS